jgi:hypothetical protein
MNNSNLSKAQLNSDVAPIEFGDYRDYRMKDLHTESISRPPYNFTENCREGDSYSHDMLNGKHADNPLADNLFSKKNIQIIQNAIRAQAYKKTKQVISEQDETQILQVMRFIYFTYAKHLPTCIASQIKELNERIVAYLVPLIVSEIKQYNIYIQDAYTTLKPQEYPEQTTSAGQRQFSLFPNM